MLIHKHAQHYAFDCDSTGQGSVANSQGNVRREFHTILEQWSTARALATQRVRPGGGAVVSERVSESSAAV